MNEGKTAVLLLRENPNRSPDPYKMEELRGLADAAGYRVLAKIKQRRERDHRFQMGRGKIAEALSYKPDNADNLQSTQPQPGIQHPNGVFRSDPRQVQPYFRDFRLPCLHARSQTAGGAG